jgi:hypothetical protein
MRFVAAAVECLFIKIPLLYKTAIASSVLTGVHRGMEFPIDSFFGL